MQHWKDLIEKANQAYSTKNYKIAVKHYQTTISVAIQSFTQEFKKDSEAAMASIVVSWLNLSDCYIALKEFDNAAFCFERAFRFVNEQNIIALDTKLTTDRHAARSRLKFTTLSKINYEWALFQKKHGQQLMPETKLKLVQTIQGPPEKKKTKSTILSLQKSCMAKVRTNNFRSRESRFLKSATHKILLSKRS